MLSQVFGFEKTIKNSTDVLTLSDLFSDILLKLMSV